MRFPFKFTRQVGAASLDPALGSDVNPTTLAAGSVAKAYLTNSNVYSSRLQNTSGYPVQRIAVGYGTDAVGLAQTIKLYMWEDMTERWYEVPHTGTTANKTIAFFDIAALVDVANVKQTGAQQGQLTSPGSMEVAIVVTPPGGDPAGVYTFIVGSDASSPA